MAVLPKVIVAKYGTPVDGHLFKDPEERGSQSLLNIQDGDTVIIGGLLREDINKKVTKLPFIGDIPFIGSAFRHRDESVTERELVIFITPHIISKTPGSQNNVAQSRPLTREQDAPKMEKR
jgi:type II secretory pathway component GspD/PulD (secretin)